MSAHANGTDKPGWVSAAIVYLTIIFLLMPLLAIVPVSFTGARYLSMPKGNWSLRHYEALLTNPVWLDSIKLSLGIAVASCGDLHRAGAAVRARPLDVRNRFTMALAALVFLPMVVPPVVSAIMLYFFETNLIDIAPWIGFDSIGGVILAHVIVATPFALVTFLVSLSQIDRRIDLAARGLGASLWQSIFRVILPNIKFGIITAAFFAFVLSWEEIR